MVSLSFEKIKKQFLSFVMNRDIDPAFLRRFERKILIELPDAKDRLEIFKTNLPEIETWEEYCMNQIADSTGYFTGDEIRIVCKEAQMMLIRQNIQCCKGLPVIFA